MHQTPGAEHDPNARSTTARYPRTARSAYRARRALRARLTAWQVGAEDIATAELVLTELVANAVRHAGDPPGRQVKVCCTHTDDGVLRIEVSDACTALPRPRETDPGPEAEAEAQAESGRGLLLVAALAADWGVTPRAYGIGKTVWADLKLTPE